MQEIQRVKAIGIDPRALGSYQPETSKREDHGPYYLISPGEPVHRVDQHDSVPHLYPMQVALCTSWGKFRYPYVGIDNPGQPFRNSDGQMVYFDTLYAGTIMRGVTEDPGNYSYLGACRIKAFDHLDPDVVNIDAFNSLIMPEPIWYGNDDLPPAHAVWHAQRYPQIEADCMKNGGMAVREFFLAEALKKLRGEGGPQARLYAEAIVEIQAACAKFRQWANAYLSHSDTEVKNQRSDKGTYDGRDVRLQWLIARKGVDVPTQPIIQVGTAEGSDIERRECSECGEMISVKAKVCRFCNARFDAEPRKKPGPKPKNQDPNFGDAE